MSPDLLEVIGGIFWIIAYLLIIVKGFKDKTYAMPLIAFCLNISWEFTFSFIYIPDLDFGLIKFIWFFLDCIIFYQILKYWKNELTKIRPIVFYLFFFSLMFISFSLVILMRREFGETFGDFYMPYFINLIMSILFIVMLYVRQSLRGQSIYIALFKLLATFVYSVWCFIFIDELMHSTLILFLYFTILFLDIIYLIMVYLFKKNKLLVLIQNTA